MPENQKYVIRSLPGADDPRHVVRLPPDQVAAMAGVVPDPAVPPAGGEPLTDGFPADMGEPTAGPLKADGMLRYNTGKGRGTLIPASFTRYTTAVLEYGAIKYSANNWRKGGSWTSAIDSLVRHLDAFREGEDLDPESGLPHLSHMAFNVMILIEFYDKGMGTDDRFRYPDQPRDAQLPGRLLEFRRPPGRE